MRLPSLSLVVRSALHTVRRFPVVLAAAITAAGAGMVAVGRSGESPDLLRLIVAAMLGLPLLFALTLFGERRSSSQAVRWLFAVTGVAILAAVWAAWPGWSPSIQGLRLVQLSVAGHLLAAFLPYAGVDEPNGFWQYNKGLFIRFLMASIYSAVLFAGLAIALFAVDKLFGFAVPKEAYARLWIFFAVVFHPWFFLGGTPAELGALETRSDYPAGLRIFTQNVLVPIVTLYLVILTLYLGKVVVTRQWPSGWIGYLVSGVAAVGILSWLLVRPLEERAEFAWVKTFTKGFWVALMPAIGMLWLAIWKRTEQYGITEPRYFLVVLSLWLAAVALFYTFSRSRNIKLIPASLCALAVLTLAGPTGAYAVSRASQLGRLRGVLTRNDLLAEGRLRRTGRDIPAADRSEISASLRYLLGTHGAGAISPWLADSLAHSLANGGPNRTKALGEDDARAIMTSLGLEYVPAGQGGPPGFFSYYAASPQGPMTISGYDYAIRLSHRTAGDSLMVADHLYLRLASDTARLLLSRDGERVLVVPLQPLLDSAAVFRRQNPNRPLPSELMRLEIHSGEMAAKLYLSQVTGRRNAAGATLTLDGDLFLKIP